MKMESQVIVNQHVTVNKYLSLVHTARHMQEVFFSQDNSFNANQSFFGIVLFIQLTKITCVKS